MAYVLYTPPQHDAPGARPRDDRAHRTVGHRIAGPRRVGYTQYRIDGVWAQKAIPTTDESLAVDSDIDGQSLFLQGGHWHWVREEIVAEIVAGGLDVGEYRPAPTGFYPSDTTYPASNAYPGEAA